VLAGVIQKVCHRELLFGERERRYGWLVDWGC
jgi:hypothetical protein